MKTSVLRRLAKTTYQVQYSPNIRPDRQYLLRLVAPGKGRIDGLPYSETHDILGFGKTLSEAAEGAFRKKDSMSVSR